MPALFTRMSRPLETWTTTGRSAVQRVTDRATQRAHVVAVDDADVGPVELLPPGPGAQNALIDSFSCGPRRSNAAPMPPGSSSSRPRCPRAVPQLRVQADAVEVARQRADVRRDRHAVVVEHDDDRGAQAAGLVDRLERDAAGHRAVADDRDDLAGVGSPRRRMPSLSPTA